MRKSAALMVAVITAVSFGSPVSGQPADTMFTAVDLKVQPYPTFELDPVTELSAERPVPLLECKPGWCRVQTRSGDGWVLRDGLASSIDSVSSARQAFLKAGYREWDSPSKYAWPTWVSSPYKIDLCATTLAHGQEFDPRRDWPGTCNTFRHTGVIQRRVAELKKIIDDLSPSARQKVVQGQVWIGAPAKAVEAAWGRPRDINSTVTASGRREQWVYPGKYVYLEDGTVTAIQRN